MMSVRYGVLFYIMSIIFCDFHYHELKDLYETCEIKESWKIKESTVMHDHFVNFQVDVSPVSDEYAVWSVFPSTHQNPSESPNPTSKLCSGALEDQYRIKLKSSNAVFANDPDPRLRAFARRLVLQADCNGM